MVGLLILRPAAWWERKPVHLMVARKQKATGRSQDSSIYIEGIPPITQLLSTGPHFLKVLPPPSHAIIWLPSLQHTNLQWTFQIQTITKRAPCALIWKIQRKWILNENIEMPNSDHTMVNICISFPITGTQYLTFLTWRSSLLRLMVSGDSVHGGLTWTREHRGRAEMLSSWHPESGAEELF